MWQSIKCARRCRSAGEKAVEKGALGRLLGDLTGCLMAGGVQRGDATLWRIEGNGESASTGDFNV